MNWMEKDLGKRIQKQREREKKEKHGRKSEKIWKKGRDKKIVFGPNRRYVTYLLLDQKKESVD